MLSDTVVELSRWQFAITAILHFLFIPLTLGLGLLLAVLDTAYVVTGRRVYLAMMDFWGRLFSINFVLAVATRLIVAFQFGMNGSYFSHYVGDVFALPMAIEAMTGFFLAATLFGIHCHGRNRLNKYQHLLLSWLIAIAVNVSAFWIMVANGWMQNPVAASFNPVSYRLELNDFALLLNNQAVLTKYLHTVSASLACAAALMIAISAHGLKKNATNPIAVYSFKLSAIIGLLALIITVFFGDSTPVLSTPVQQAKLAAIQGEDLSRMLPGIESRIRSGIQAYASLQELRDDKKDPHIQSTFEQHKSDLGYAWLLIPWNKHIADANDRQISLAAQSALPAYPGLLFWSYRCMIAGGVLGSILFLMAVWKGFSKTLPSDTVMKLCLYLAPFPWFSALCGWFVAEVGKQPWAVAGELPTFMSVSSISVFQLLISSLALACVYAVLLTGGFLLMRKTITNLHTVSGAQA